MNIALKFDRLASLRVEPDQVSQPTGGGPSANEGFGIPLQEAMSLDCSAICSKTSSFSEVDGDAAEYSPPHTTEALRYTLKALLPSSSRRQELIKRGRQRCQLFSWQRCANETLAVYRRLL
jgi:glycosyltransferase involved in cell wall biosynthesis